jgi:uncharacterized cupredoxin-like copper-binding protein
VFGPGGRSGDFVRSPRFVSLAVACLIMAAVGCSADRHSDAATEVVPFDLVNFQIVGPAHVRAGLVRFVLTGVGPTMHEFNVARTDEAPAALPLAPDGTVDDQVEHRGFEHLAEREGVDIGDHASLTVQLAPGRYVLYCNMYGHYEAGMRAELVVS